MRRYLKQAPTAAGAFTADPDVASVVSDVIADVRERGDAAVRAYSEKFDHWSPADFRLSPDEISAIVAGVDPQVLDDIRTVQGNVRAFAERQRASLADFEVEAQPGVFLGQRSIPVGSVGAYVPGGRYPLVASAHMTVVTATVAGVDAITACTPPIHGELPATTIAAMHLAGATDILVLGGVQAVAALAVGTETIAKVDLIAGPGNAYVAEAKRQLFGEVGIDLFAGPTEILVIADDAADPEVVAVDLLSQAEHGPDSPAVLVTTSRSLGEKVLGYVEAILPCLPTNDFAGPAWRDHGQILVVDSVDEAFAVADSFADAGFAVVAIDLPLHGVTTPYNAANPATYFYASSANPLYAGLGLPASGSIERTFDLDVINPPAIDSSGSHFINLTSLLTSRDNLREGAADLITFERSVSNAVVANAGNAKMFLAGQTHYLGHSLGAIVGAVFLGVVPATDVSTGTLANPGGDLSQLLITSPSFAPVINAGLEAQGLVPGTTLYSQFFRDSQNVIDAGDPINYIAQTTELHPIHLLQVVGSAPPPAGCNAATFINGCPDQVVPNSATQAMLIASTYGLAPLAQVHATATPLPTVISSAAGVRAYVNFVQGDHGSVIDDVVPAVTGEMQAEAISFTGAPIPPLGIPANTPGSTLVLGLVSSSVIQ